MPSVAASLLPAIGQTFAIILFGYVARALGLIDAQQVGGVGRFVGIAAIPPLLFSAVATSDLGAVNWTVLLGILLSKGLVFAATGVFTALTLPSSDTLRYAKAGINAVFVTSSNDLALGVPLFTALYATDPNGTEYVQMVYILSAAVLVIILPFGFAAIEAGIAVHRAAQRREALESGQKLLGGEVEDVDDDDDYSSCSEEGEDEDDNEEGGALETVSAAMQNGMDMEQGAMPTLAEEASPVADNCDCDEQADAAAAIAAQLQREGRLVSVAGLDRGRDASKGSAGPQYLVLEEEEEDVAIGRSDSMASRGRRRRRRRGGIRTAQSEMIDPSSEPSVCAKVMWGMGTNPVVLSVLLGVVWNVSIGPNLGVFFGGLLGYLGQTFTACALFVLGASMYGRLGDIGAAGFMMPTLLVAAKTIILPGVCAAILSALGVTNGYIAFGFLYGVIPAAPMVYMWARSYKLDNADLIGSYMIVCTLASAPMLYVSAQMAAISLSRENNAEIMAIASQVVLVMSIISLVAGLWMLLATITHLAGRWSVSLRTQCALVILFGSVLASAATISCQGAAGNHFSPVRQFSFVLGRSLAHAGVVVLILSDLAVFKHGYVSATRQWAPWAFGTGAILSVIVAGLSLLSSYYDWGRDMSGPRPSTTSECSASYVGFNDVFDLCFTAGCALIAVAALVRVSQLQTRLQAQPRLGRQFDRPCELAGPLRASKSRGADGSTPEAGSRIELTGRNDSNSSACSLFSGGGRGNSRTQPLLQGERCEDDSVDAVLAIDPAAMHEEEHRRGLDHKHVGGSLQRMATAPNAAARQTSGEYHSALESLLASSCKPEAALDRQSRAVSHHASAAALAGRRQQQQQQQQRSLSLLPFNTARVAFLQDTQADAAAMGLVVYCLVAMLLDVILTTYRLVIAPHAKPGGITYEMEILISVLVIGQAVAVVVCFGLRSPITSGLRMLISEAYKGLGRFLLCGRRHVPANAAYDWDLEDRPSRRRHHHHHHGHHHHHHHHGRRRQSQHGGLRRRGGGRNNSVAVSTQANRAAPAASAVPARAMSVQPGASAGGAGGDLLGMLQAHAASPLPGRGD